MLHPFVLTAACLLAGEASEITLPEVKDTRLKLEIVAEAPDLVTPTAVTVDQQGRVFVVESHTHFPPQDYQGPRTDWIRWFQDADGDGRAEARGVYYEGPTHTMGLGAYHDGSLFVATRSQVFRLWDRDHDGRAEERMEIARLETTGNYPHNGLSGFAFDFAGNVYFGFGENLGADYRLIGSDGTSLAGGGEGGNIYRCRPDGSGLTLVATGFWNPFHLGFDAFGRLFAVDNDPDFRPPCRLLQIVDGGDYGYRFRNGRRGLHPFTAWNGELPGTLPMVSGTGEAPSAVLAYESDGLPSDYVGDLLVTSWGDHRIERYRLTRRGAAFTGQMIPVVIGDENFRPVGMAVAPDGSVYFSDWVDKSYELHGRGRLWRLSGGAPQAHRPTALADRLRSPDRAQREAAARQLATAEASSGSADPVAVLSEALRSDNPRSRATAFQALCLADVAAPARLAAMAAERSEDVLELMLSLEPAEHDGLRLASQFSTPPGVSPVLRAAALRRVTKGTSRGFLFEQLEDSDPFVRQAAGRALAATQSLPSDVDPLSVTNAAQRLGVVLALRQRKDVAAQRLLPQLLRDPDPAIRFLAIQWIGEEKYTDLRPELEAMLSERAETRELFEASLAAIEMLDGVRRDSGQEWAGEQYVLGVLKNPDASLAVRRRALRSLRPDHPELTLDLLRQLLSAQDAELRLEAIRTLRGCGHAEKTQELSTIALAETRPVDERAEAIVGLVGSEPAANPTLLELACGAPDELAHEALRSLRGTKLDAADAARLRDRLPQRSPSWQELATRILDPDRQPERPAADDTVAWLRRLEGPADPDVGARIFFHAQAAGCYRCHEANGRGASYGPNLTATGKTLTRERLLESILQPSREMAPHFVPWTVLSNAGQVFTGLYLGQDNENLQRYIDQQGREIRIKQADIEERRPSDQSIMPAGLEKTLTDQELRDLLEFLRHAST